MLYDIAALQARFGANMSYQTGNNNYTGPAGTIQAIWDAGGVDRFDATGKQQPVTIDLREGAFSSMGATNNLAIAYGAVIENATGSAFGDTITGNEIANELVGAGGNDTIDGGNSNTDTAVFSGTRAQYKTTQLTATSVRLEELRGGTPDGTDTVSNVELFRFADGTFAFAEVISAPVAGSVSIVDAAVVEGNNGTSILRFTVNRSGGTAAFDVNWATSNGTATTADGDYVAGSNVVRFLAGDLSKTFDVVVNGDTKFETNETLNVTLSNPTNGATILDGQGVGTINNDDAAPLSPASAIHSAPTT